MDSLRTDQDQHRTKNRSGPVGAAHPPGLRSPGCPSRLRRHLRRQKHYLQRLRRRTTGECPIWNARPRRFPNRLWSFRSVRRSTRSDTRSRFCATGAGESGRSAEPSSRPPPLDTSNVGERLRVEQNPTAHASSQKSFSSSVRTGRWPTGHKPVPGNIWGTSRPISRILCITASGDRRSSICDRCCQRPDATYPGTRASSPRAFPQAYSRTPS